MANDGRPSRRTVLSGGAALAGFAGLAGCSGADDSTPSDRSDGGDDDESATTKGPEPADAGPVTGSEAGYVVSMAPVGEVAFETVPETWFPYTADYADMGVALGRADGLAAVGVRARYGAHLYEELPGVSVDLERLTQLWRDGTGKEVFYELDADVHVIDPYFLVERLRWSRADVEEVAANVAPFLGNTIFTRAYDWHDYRYYDLYSAFETVAELFRERERFEAFSSYHDAVLSDLESRLPAETPDVAVLYPAEVPPESFYPYLIGEGTQSEHWNDLGVACALTGHGVTDAQAGGGTIDYETLLEIDPDAIAVRLQGRVTPDAFERRIAAPMREHGVGGKLRAVREGRVIYGGLTYQGPIVHLFQLERAARELHPEVFGEERLFDRDRVAEIVVDGR